MTEPSRAERLLILGLDGGTWTVFDPMIERGVMPNLKALRNASRWGSLLSCKPPVTSAAWTTMMTGCSPARHGVFDHRYFDLDADRMKVNHSGRVRVPTVWQQVSRAGGTVVSLNLPVTYPAPAVRGLIVSGMDAPHLEAATASAPWFHRQLVREVPDYHMRVLWKNAPRDRDEIRHNAEQTIRLFQARAEAALLADRSVSDWTTLMVQFQNLDPFQHRVWPWLNVDSTGIDNPPWNRAAEEVLRGLDRAIGRLCELACQRRAAVMAVSDHGFGPCRGRIHINRVLTQAGVARPHGTLGQVRHRLRQMRDRYAIWSAKRKDPEARVATYERSIAGQFPLDWRRTLGFAPHQDTGAMIYLNRRSDRRPMAPLTQESQCQQALDEIEAAVAEARHPETGTPLFPERIRVAETYRVDPSREGYPDLIALPVEDYWVRTKLTPGDALIDPDPNLPGTHRPEGIVLLQAPGVIPEHAETADLRDVTPTILSLLGLPIPNTVEGSSLVRNISRTNLGSVGREAIRHDRAEEPLGSTPHAFEHSETDQALIEKRLADLGYLE